MDSLASSISVEEFLQKISLFEKCSSIDIHTLAMHVHDRVYKKGESILFQGVISNQLYLVAKGLVGVYSRKEGVTRFLAKLPEGSYFGEISLLKSCAATATVKSEVDGTQVFALDADAVNDIIQHLPEVKADLEIKVRERNRSRLEAFEKAPEESSPAPSPTAS
ncbi:MAG TPA: cyclic nucleotide-binding domain-containing protein [Elusimicrobiota bacterium]|nr:cyclic nucleotide-binding domain-containing protein [Elusimicrobiota bacterium]